MIQDSIIPYLVLDIDSNTLSIQYVDWDKFSFAPKQNDPDNIFDYFIEGMTYTDIENSLNMSQARQDFLKAQIIKRIPAGVIVSSPRMEGNFYYDEWDALNLIKFEIHADFSEDLTYLKLKWFLRPVAISTFEAINGAFESGISIQDTYFKEEDFEVSLEGWIKCYEKAIAIQNQFIVNISKEIDNTPYYNTKIQWER